MTKHVFIGQEYFNHEDLIDSIIHNTTRQYLIFDDSNNLIMIKTLHALDDETSLMTIGKVYNFINGVPEPFYNYFQKYYPDANIKNFSLQLNDEELNEFINTYIFIINIEEFTPLCINEYTEKLEKIKQNCLNDIDIKKEDQLNNIKIFEIYANEYKKSILKELQQVFNNKYEENAYEDYIFDEIKHFQKEYISKIIKGLVEKYLYIV